MTPGPSYLAADSRGAALARLGQRGCRRWAAGWCAARRRGAQARRPLRAHTAAAPSDSRAADSQVRARDALAGLSQAAKRAREDPQKVRLSCKATETRHDGSELSKSVGMRPRAWVASHAQQLGGRCLTIASKRHICHVLCHKTLHIRVTRQIRAAPWHNKRPRRHEAPRPPRALRRAPGYTCPSRAWRKACVAPTVHQDRKWSERPGAAAPRLTALTGWQRHTQDITGHHHAC